MLELLWLSLSGLAIVVGIALIFSAGIKIGMAYQKTIDQIKAEQAAEARRNFVLYDYTGRKKEMGK